MSINYKKSCDKNAILEEENDEYIVWCNCGFSLGGKVADKNKMNVEFPKHFLLKEKLIKLNNHLVKIGIENFSLHENILYIYQNLTKDQIAILNIYFGDFYQNNDFYAINIKL